MIVLTDKFNSSKFIIIIKTLRENRTWQYCIYTFCRSEIKKNILLEELFMIGVMVVYTFPQVIFL